MINSKNKGKSRLGIHYYPDTFHYRKQDVDLWIPELLDLNFSWIVLQAPLSHAIPEYFIKSLIKNGIIPIIHFTNIRVNSINTNQIEIFIKTYSDWGIKFICVLDKPNLVSSWSENAWYQHDIVEYFLDNYLPIAQLLNNHGITPIFPPLEPGGDFWDLSFLRLSVKGMIKRGFRKLLKHMAIGLYAWNNYRPLNWGIGGPENWPNSLPYTNTSSSQNHFGFRIFDWYTAIIQSEFGQKLPLIILKSGDVEKNNENSEESSLQPIIHAENCIAISQLFNEDNHESPKLLAPHDNEHGNTNSIVNNSVPDELLCCNFWLLSSSNDSNLVDQAWYKPDGSVLPVVSGLKRFWGESSISKKPIIQSKTLRATPNYYLGKTSFPKNIRHYLLLPVHSWGVDVVELNSALPFIQRYHPTIGFSINEAANSRRVTIFGDTRDIPKEFLLELKQQGCKLDLLTENGTILAI